MSWSSCQPYQPLPISTGTVGIDRCGNIEVYAAPSVVRNHVRWGCWPIQTQQPGWPVCPPGWSGGGWPPWWGWGGGQGSWGPGPIDPGFTAPPWWGPGWQGVVRGGAAAAEWAISMRRTLSQPRIPAPPVRRAA